MSRILELADRVRNAVGRLPAPVRHLVLAALAVVIPAVWEAWRSGEVRTPGGLAVVAWAALLAWATPLVQSYGLGKLREVLGRFDV
ncbi:MAG: hypothetical protein A2Y78_10095 [Acidobacteria bacterium RBG_13_68_16]|nr:MAG: hypothetical protein A2Y78_10095 [Acidobacteria bacterium RBG_13_68_16]